MRQNDMWRGLSRGEKRRQKQVHRQTIRDLKRMNGRHDRWIRLGQFAVAHGRHFVPGADTYIGHHSQVVFYATPDLVRHPAHT